MHREPVPNPTPPPPPIPSAPPPLLPPPPPIAQPMPFGMPRDVGPYQVQRVLGAGGMATVYAALQKQPRRTVAIKVMKAGIVQSRGESALRRFKREIEILGKLNHPYIAAVYDAGTFDDGSGATPYFVMEYIPGALNILEYIARKDLNQRERLKLFVKVCAAVEHGHRNRIIHRDLKPGNILIDQYGEPKVIDFGIATAAEVDVSHQTLQADAGRIVGTLQYMAPEQVETRGVDLDGRCDVYALGVLLYRITTGKPPYDLEALPVYEAVRIIREERPARPSETNAEVRGDLETIILKAMEPERARRYRSAGSLGRDVVRYLANKPIKARRASAVYRTTLFAKRNAVVLAVIAVIGLVAAVALGYTMWERARLSERQERERQAIAERERDLVRRREEIDARAVATQAAATAAMPREEMFTLAEHTGGVTQLRFVPSADGEPLLVSVASDHQLLLWNLHTRKVAQRIDPLGAGITVLAASADGSTLAVTGASSDDPIAILRSVDGKIVRTLRDVDGPVTSLALGSSGEVVAWGASNLTLNLRATEARGPLPRDNPRREPRSMRSGTGAFTALAFSANERLLAAGTQGGVVWVWEPRAIEQQPANHSGASRSPALRFTDLNAPIIALALIEAGEERRLIAVADDGHACTWHDDGRAWRAATWTAGDKPVIAAAFSSNGAYLAIATADGVQAWSIGAADASPQRIGTLIKSDDTPAAIAIDDRGQRLAIGFSGGDVRMATIAVGAARE